MKYLLVFAVMLLMGATVLVVGAEGCVCPAVYTPVCATNGKTYSNPCSLKCAKAKFAYNGSC